MDGSEAVAKIAETSQRVGSEDVTIAIGIVALLTAFIVIVLFVRAWISASDKREAKLAEREQQKDAEASAVTQTLLKSVLREIRHGGADDGLSLATIVNSQQEIVRGQRRIEQTQADQGKMLAEYGDRLAAVEQRVEAIKPQKRAANGRYT